MNVIKNCIFMLLLVFGLISQAQEKLKDTIPLKDIYGFRVGLDVSNPIRTLFNEDRKSLEIIGDYRINKKLYAAVELGFLDKKTLEDHLDYTTNGQYIKIGANYNLYENWLDMDNEVFVGMRYGLSTFKQTLHSYTVYSDSSLPEIDNVIDKEFSGLTANWGELVFGMKVETFHNIFLSASFSFKKIISTKEPENFKNLYAPGFDRIFLNNGGIGFNYVISYRLPLYKKNKISVEEPDDKEAR